MANSVYVKKRLEYLKAIQTVSPPIIKKEIEMFLKEYEPSFTNADLSVSKLSRKHEQVRIDPKCHTVGQKV
jgi:hypothetical protein